MKTEYNKILDQDKAVARVYEALLKYQDSARARSKTIYFGRINRKIELHTTDRGFRTICAALRDHAENLAKHNFSIESISHSKADIIDVALLQLNAD